MIGSFVCNATKSSRFVYKHERPEEGAFGGETIRVMTAHHSLVAIAETIVPMPAIGEIGVET